MGEELWYVKLANGDVHRVTIDQLDGAFQAGHIDESTMVLAAGASQWTKLGDLAGLDEGDAPAPPPEPSAEESAYAPQAGVASSVATECAAPVVDAPVVDAAPPAPPRGVDEILMYVPQTRPPPYVAPVYAAPVAVAIRTVAAPVAARTVAAPVPYAAHAAYAPPAQGAPYSVAVSTRPAAIAAPQVANSLRPMSMDLSDLDLDAPFKRKPRAGRFVAAVIAMAAIAGGAAIASNRLHLHLGIGGSASDLSNVAAAAAIAAPPPVADRVVAPPPAAPLPPAASPSPATVNAATSDGSPMNPQFTSRFNEDTTKKLLSADKSRESKAKSRHSGGGASGSSHTKSTTFTTGGNKFDPLNSAI